jgi:uronate dehydrogenase
MADARNAARRIVFTGAAGGIGTMTRPLLAGLYPGLVLSDRVEPADLQPHETFVPADLTQPDEVAAALAGADSVIHLGGHSVEGTWDQILQANIVGCYNVFEAAREAGVKRVIFASSNHAIGFYPRSQRIGTDVTVRPDSRYGVSKVFGEALGSLYSDKHGMAVTCLRIGNVGPVPLDVRRLSIWISPRDLVQLFQMGWWDNSRAHQLGYRPQDKSEDHRAHAEAEQARIGPDPVGDLFQGGSFCSAEFTNDVKRAGP